MPQRNWLGWLCSDCQRERAEQERHSEREKSEERRHIEKMTLQRLHHEESLSQLRFDGNFDYATCQTNSNCVNIPWSWYEKNIQHAMTLIEEASAAHKNNELGLSCKLYSEAARLLFEAAAVANYHLPAYRGLVLIALNSNNEEHRKLTIAGLRKFSNGPRERIAEARNMMIDLGVAPESLSKHPPSRFARSITSLGRSKNSIFSGIVILLIAYYLGRIGFTSLSKIIYSSVAIYITIRLLQR